MILDTSYLIDLMDGLPEAVQKMQQLHEKKENIFITVVSVFELWSGIVRSQKSDQEKRKVLTVLQSQLILDLNQPSAEEAGKIDGVLAGEGLNIDAEDSMIAGIARHYGVAVLTRNIKHFKRIKGLIIETY